MALASSLSARISLPATSGLPASDLAPCQTSSWTGAQSKFSLMSSDATSAPFGNPEPVAARLHVPVDLSGYSELAAVEIAAMLKKLHVPVEPSAHSETVGGVSDDSLLVDGAQEMVAAEGGRKYISMPKTLFDEIRHQLAKARRSPQDWDHEADLVDNMDRVEEKWDDAMKRAGSAVPPPPKPAQPLSRKEILAPLNQVFLKDEVMDRVLIAAGVPELLAGQNVKNNGCILIGPPGTGKTVLERALAKVYEKAGAYAVEVSEAAISESTVGSKARNLDAIIKKALEEARKRGKPALIYFDEASSSVSKPEANSSVRSYYQEALDTMKRYIGNYPELVFVISTNASKQLLDDALVREGRLQVIQVDRPDLTQKVRMWDHFLREYHVIDGLSREQLVTLASLLPAESQGAAIELFCRTFIDKLKLEKLKSLNHTNLLSALESDVKIAEEDIRPLINYGYILSELRKVVATMTLDAEPKEKKARVIGFGADQRDEKGNWPAAMRFPPA